MEKAGKCMITLFLSRRVVVTKLEERSLLTIGKPGLIPIMSKFIWINIYSLKDEQLRQ